MAERFVQRQIPLNSTISTGKLKVSTLVGLLKDHKYLPAIEKAFDVANNVNDIIIVHNIDVVYNRVARIKREYIFYNVLAQSKDILFTRNALPVEDLNDNQPLVFNFNEYVDSNGEIQKNLKAFAIYESKNTFFEEFSMSKFANMLFDNGLDDLAEDNLNYFKKVSKIKPTFNTHKSYRLVENNSENFVRGITSDKYSEFGVDFTFVVSMLMLHKNMKQTKGNNYEISFAAINESKLNMIISSSQSKSAGDFGMVSSAIAVSTNDLGKGALEYTSIIKLDVKGNGIYLYPRTREIAQKNININHIRGPKSVLEILSSAQDFYDFIDVFIVELQKVKRIDTPNELRSQILNKIAHPNNPLSKIKDLQDIFKKEIDNQIKDFAKLLELCNKAEELEIEYELKEKVRYIISQVILP